MSFLLYYGIERNMGVILGYKLATSLVFSLSGFANLSTKITTKREFRLSSAERKHSAIPAQRK